MPEWAMQLLVAGGGLALIGGGIRAWWTAWLEDRKAKSDAAAAEKKSQQERTEKLEGKVESLLHDAAASAKELNAQLIARIDMDEKQNTVIAANTEALKENAKLYARIEALLSRLLETKP